MPAGEAPSARVRAGGVPPAAAPHRVRVPVNLHDWNNLTFLHWPVDPDMLATLVPDDLTLLTHNGAAWVTVTPFFIRVWPPGPLPIPRVGAFPETNVRTYVGGPDGREGLWFLRMEVTAGWFVAALRALGLPYVRQRMRVDVEARRIIYRSASPDGRQPSHHIVVHPGPPLSPPAGGPQERFLTARWGAYHRRERRLFYTPADHPPWPLQAVDVETADVEPLLRTAGLAIAVGSPVAQFSPGVRVRIGRPQLVR